RQSRHHFGKSEHDRREEGWARWGARGSGVAQSTAEERHAAERSVPETEKEKNDESDGRGDAMREGSDAILLSTSLLEKFLSPSSVPAALLARGTIAAPAAVEEQDMGGFSRMRARQRKTTDNCTNP